MMQETVFWRVSSSRPNFYVVCREDATFLVGTDHDLFITASSAKNRLYGTIAAEEKIPPVATHPKGKLINNILTLDHQDSGHIKICGDYWKEVHVDDLSCSSSHYFHKWNQRISKRGIIKGAKER